MFRGTSVLLDFRASFVGLITFLTAGGLDDGSILFLLTGVWKSGVGSSKKKASFDGIVLELDVIVDVVFGLFVFSILCHM